MNARAKSFFSVAKASSAIVQRTICLISRVVSRLNCTMKQAKIGRKHVTRL